MCTLYVVLLCRLQFLPFSLTSLDNLTAVWIAENQNRPLLDLQLTRSGEGEKMLTCILLPQQPADSPISSECELSIMHCVYVYSGF